MAGYSLAHGVVIPMNTARFVLLTVLISFGFGVLPLPDGPWRNAGKAALVLAAALYVTRPENRRRLRVAATVAAAPDQPAPRISPASSARRRTRLSRRTLLFALTGMAVTASLLGLAIFDSVRLREIFSLLDQLLRYPEVDAYLWLVSLAIAGRSWRLESNRTRALRRAQQPPPVAAIGD